MHKSVGVVGLNSRAVAESAKRLGFRAYLVDYFYDSDINAENHFFMQRNPLMPNLSKEYSAERLAEFAIDNLDGVVDSIILTSGIGCNYRIVKKLEKHFEILGNSSAKIKNSKDWRKIKTILDRIGVSYPETIAAKSVRDVERAVNRLGYPLVAKSMIKDAGILPGLIRNKREMGKFCRISQNKNIEILVQRYIEGIPISVSLLGNGENAISLSVNRQLIGVREFGASKNFTYCGNIVPFDGMTDKNICGFSEKIISNLKLIGSNGIDYVLSNNGEIFFMEINPRFQDTIGSVEKFCNTNLVEKHLNAIDGMWLGQSLRHMSARMRAIGSHWAQSEPKVLIREPKGFSHILEYPEDYSRRYYGKGIVFADKKISFGNFNSQYKLYCDKKIIVSGLRRLSNISNIPHDGTVIQKGEPICSIFAEGRSNEKVMDNLLMKARRLKKDFFLSSNI